MLKPGGRFALEMNNRDGVIRQFQPASADERDGDLLIDRRRFEPLTGRIVKRTVVRDGRVRRVPYFVRMFTFTELRDWLLDGGFTSVEGYAEDGGPLALHSRRMITVAVSGMEGRDDRRVVPGECSAPVPALGVRRR